YPAARIHPAPTDWSGQGGEGGKRGQCQAGHAGVVTADALEVERNRQQGRVHDQVTDPDRRAGGGEGSGAEEAQIDDRRGAAQLPEYESGSETESAEGEGDTQGRLTELEERRHDDQCGQGRREEGGPGDIEVRAMSILPGSV